MPPSDQQTQSAAVQQSTSIASPDELEPQQSAERTSYVSIDNGGGVNAVMVASGDSVRMYLYDPKTKQRGEQIMDTTWSQINHAVTVYNTIRFRVGEYRYDPDFNPALTRALNTIGGGRGYLSHTGRDADMDEAIQNTEGIDDFKWWMQAFASHGIPVKDSLGNHPGKIMAVGVALLLMLCLIWAVVAGAHQP